jgi:hypothetical protein
MRTGIHATRIIAYCTSDLAGFANEDFFAGSHETEARQLALFHTVPQPTAHDRDIFRRACGVGAWEAIYVTSPPVSVKRFTTVAAQLPKPIPALP